jgi:hypothetical protein
VVGCRLLGLEAGQEDPDAELELVVGGDPCQQGGELDGVGELARGQGGEEAVEAADELVAGLGSVPARGISRATNPRM